MKIQASSELMTNQKHATVMSPQGRFRVLQTQRSHLLALSIGTDGRLYRTLETPGLQAGWSARDELASLPVEFRGSSVAKLFDASVNRYAASADVALALTSGGRDHLLLALDLDNQDRAWDEPLQWASIPFDDPSGAADTLTIVGLYLLRDRAASFIVVDILQDPADPLGLIQRYFIDPTRKLSGKYWNRHELPISLQAGGVSSRLGRKSQQLVGGIYTLGSLTGAAELIYSQIYNPYDPVHGNPLTTRIELPDGAVATETVFALGERPDPSSRDAIVTDLYVAARGGLYFLAASEQSDRAPVRLLLEHPLLRGVIALQVDSNDDEIVVCGLNEFGAVFCLRSQPGQQHDPASWSVPVPLLNDGQGLSALVNRSQGGSVLFVHDADDRLVELVESAVTRLWSKRSIVLPATDPKDMLSFDTYTTHVQVGGDDKLPAREQTLAMRAASPVSVYVNDRYVQLSPDTQVEVKTDARGTLTVLQQVKSLGAVMYYFDFAGATTVVDPMDKARSVLSKVKTGVDLDVQVVDSRGRKHPLVNPSISAKTKDAAAQTIAGLVEVSDSLPSDGGISTAAAMLRSRPFDGKRDTIFGISFVGPDAVYFGTAADAAAAGVLTAIDADGGYRSDSENAIWATAGDILEWISHAADDVGHFFVEIVDGIATGLVKIAGEAYRFVLDCVQTVAAAISFVLQKIEVLMQDLIRWLGFLFEWPDIVRTHRAIKNLFKQFARYSVGELATVKQEIVGLFGTIEREIGKWTDLPDLPGSASLFGRSSPLPADYSAPQVHWGAYHLGNGAASAATAYTQYIAETDPLRKMLDELVQAFEREEQTFENVIARIKADLIDGFDQLSATQILQRAIAIVLDALLETIENVVGTIIDAIAILVDGVVEFLDAPIDVPIISQLYEEATEGDRLSILDAVCLAVAIPTTVLYKIAESAPPFPDDAFTDELIRAPSFQAIQALYARTGTGVQADPGPTRLEKICFYASMPAAALMTFLVPLRTQFPNNRPLALIGAGTYLFYCAPNLPAIVETGDRKRWYNDLDFAITVVSVIKACADIGLTNYVKAPAGEAANGACLTFWNKASPVCEFLINGFWFVPVIAAIVERHEQADVMNCIANSGFNIGGMMALPMSSNAPEPYAVGLVGFLAGNTAYGYLNWLQAGLDADAAAAGTAQCAPHASPAPA